MFIYFNDRATTEFYTLSLHDALPIFESVGVDRAPQLARPGDYRVGVLDAHVSEPLGRDAPLAPLGVHLVEAAEDRKSTRLNSSHANISYAVFCLKKQ